MYLLKAFVCVLAVIGFASQAQEEVDINNLPDLQYVDGAGDNNFESANGSLRRGNRNGGREVVQVQEENIASPSQGVVILNSNTNANSNRADAVLQQPPTYVEASPLTDSRAEQLRRARQAAEVNTEQKIVEKLETSRLEDERDRANRLFGSKWQRPEPQQPVYPPQHVPVYGQYDQPKHTVEVVNVDQDKQDLNSVKEEILEAVKEVQAEKMKVEDLHHEKPKPEGPKDRYYIGTVLGVADYNASNVEGNGAGGFTLGTVTRDGIIVEGSFLYSNYYLDQWWAYDFFKEIDQYNFGMAVKYSPLKKYILPYVGAHMSYTYRKYTDRTYDYCCTTSSNDRRDPRRQGGYDPYPQDKEVTSNAVDFGFLIGLDFFASESFAIGVEYKYSMNMFNKSESDFINRGDWRAPQNSEPLEEIDYSVFGISGKFAF